MKIVSIFSTRKNKQFNYKPIYYDAQKEALQEQIKQAKADISIEQEERKINFKAQWQARNKKKKQTSYSPNFVRLIIFATILVVLIYFFLQ